MRIVSRQPSNRAPARVAPLSVLPVFLDLHGKRVVVAGGSDAAAWKAELLAAAGARVHVYAPSEAISDEMALLLAAGGASPSYVHHDQEWSAENLAGAVLAVADAGSNEEATAFHAAARSAGVPCNVIDRPDHCVFQFGSIVNRSPVVIGISTSGAAPILAQAIRRRVEALLPPSLAEWADLAQRLRETVMKLLPAASRRRAFWETFADRAFGRAPLPGEALRLSSQVAEIAADAALACGRVTFVDAGPGDAELLTLKAVRALQAADVILFDDEVSGDVLELARREATRVAAGTCGGREKAGDTLVSLARSGRHVVRLKPSKANFGNGEISRLRAEGIAFDIVPGVSVAKVRAASRAHRVRNEAGRFAAGHARNMPGEERATARAVG
ncbi:siroheme synthase [Mesorhizobium sp. AaZ16]|uniref:siroheme synthase family protein n=1 Tax=Mesorhizobium sp. AaZ16 TaxID=3402289 RepID=UPI00374EB3F1